MIRDASTASQLLAAAAAAAAGDHIRLVSNTTYDLGAAVLNLPSQVHLHGSNSLLTSIATTASQDHNGCILSPGGGNLIDNTQVVGYLDIASGGTQAAFGFDLTADSPQPIFTSCTVRRCSFITQTCAINFKATTTTSLLRCSFYDCYMSTFSDGVRLAPNAGVSWDAIIDFFNCMMDMPSSLVVSGPVGYQVTAGTVRVFGGYHRVNTYSTSPSSAKVLNSIGTANARVEAYGATLLATHEGGGTALDANQGVNGIMILNKDCVFSNSRLNGTIRKQGGEWPALPTNNVHLSRR